MDARVFILNNNGINNIKIDNNEIRNILTERNMPITGYTAIDYKLANRMPITLREINYVQELTGVDLTPYINADKIAAQKEEVEAQRLLQKHKEMLKNINKIFESSDYLLSNVDGKYSFLKSKMRRFNKLLGNILPLPKEEKNFYLESEIFKTSALMLHYAYYGEFSNEIKEDILYDVYYERNRDVAISKIESVLGEALDFCYKLWANEIYLQKVVEEMSNDEKGKFGANVSIAEFSYEYLKSIKDKKDFNVHEFNLHNFEKITEWAEKNLESIQEYSKGVE
ncbi:hypothetical protein LS70_003945 [Helicobacter sp. MIT 11-5569]|uniref:hypothetical protein n=1 Tax=Helicobacter sp. MIT 11-5569 TaxID=1548151 RepID=UPI00051FB655|nr:hypothetical protein [Helicobacter sp. MIT 11-5569]TLD83968.1 hypothetical protein LS70_003945 [Helicobacter sp. MIT 11-5569]